MKTYLNWNEQTITDYSDANVNAMYDQGYVFTRKGRGIMHQTRSLRIDLSKFELSSENRRILKKNEQLTMNNEQLPYRDYIWKIGKMAKVFYETKFGKGTFSANKMREIMTDPEKSNFNQVFVYTIPLLVGEGQGEVSTVGYCIALETDTLIHYSYPFYNLQATSYPPAIASSSGEWRAGKLPANTGLGMMIKAILYAKENGKKYIYLGSAQRPTDTYKLQFTGIEWFDGKQWQNNINELKMHICQK